MNFLTSIIRAHGFVQIYRRSFRGLYVSLYLMVMSAVTLLDVAFNNGAMKEALGVAIFYPFLYVLWTIISDIARWIWAGLGWCIQQIGSRMSF